MSCAYDLASKEKVFFLSLCKGKQGRCSDYVRPPIRKQIWVQNMSLRLVDYLDESSTVVLLWSEKREMENCLRWNTLDKLYNSEWKICTDPKVQIISSQPRLCRTWHLKRYRWRSWPCLSEGSRLPDSSMLLESDGHCCSHNIQTKLLC